MRRGSSASHVTTTTVVYHNTQHGPGMATTIDCRDRTAEFQQCVVAAQERQQALRA
jgi:hypothetical protein|eukprot:SAG25_NODE_939_length_4667_cov_9.559379_2_plen_56_part_00